MQGFSSRMESGGRFNNYASYSRGGGRNGGGGYGGRGSDDRGAMDEAFNAATSGFFSDLDRSGRYRQQQQQQPPQSRGGGSHAVAPLHEKPRYHEDNDALLSEERPAANGDRARGDSKSGKQTQDSVLWIELGLCKALTRAVAHLGFLAPTPVQTQAIPMIMGGTDCCVRAVTGSGKTAAFVLPMLHRILTMAPAKQSAMHAKRRYIRGLILVPSRELGVQCYEMTKQMMAFTTEVRIALAIGGIAAQAQEAALEQAPEMVIATPGRFVDILHNYKGPHGGVDLSGVELVCLDECDKMLTITLKDQVMDILDRIPPETRQMLLFSATMTSEVDEFAKLHLFEPKNIDIGHVALASQLRQQFVRIKIDGAVEAVAAGGAGGGGGDVPRPCRRKNKNTNAGPEDERMDSASDVEGDDDTPAAAKKKRIRSKRLRDEQNAGSIAEEQKVRDEEELLGPAMQEHVTKIKTRYLVVMCEQYFKKAVLIFTKYRSTAHRLQKVFSCLGLKSSELQGNQLQEERFEALRQFASGEVQYLFCTDVASRGLDIKGVNTVINFDLPPTLTAYIHRVGRTARIGEAGTAVSLVHEVVDADIMRKILTVSGNINQHQVASVKRRDVPVDLLDEALVRINAAFPRVKEILAAEMLAQKVALAEKMLSKERSDPRATFALSDAIAAKPKRQWCLSKKERKERDEAARKKYECEAEVVIEEAQQELAELGKQESKFLQRQKNDRRQVREKKQRVRDKELEKIKTEKKKHSQKIQAGNVKALKKKKIRESRKEQRAENREKKGRAPFKRREKKAKTKSRHVRRPKKH